MKTFSKTDIGRVRKRNQDYVYVSNVPVGNLPNLLIVADGMGGHNGGEFASSFVVNKVVNEISLSALSGPEAILKDAVQIAHEELKKEAEKEENLKGMGTTLVVATVIEHTLYFTNVGDSRLYLIDDEIKQLSKDHSLVQEMVRLGGIPQEEAKNHPDKNVITRAIGMKDKLDIDFFQYRIKPNDTILMCTDGLSNMLEDEEIFKIVKAGRDVVEVGSELIDRANENGGSDNIGIIVAQLFEEEVNI